MSTMHRSQWFTLVLASVAAVVVASCILVLPHADDTSMFDEERYERELLDALNLDEDDETVVRGVVSRTTQECEHRREHCHFVLELDGLQVSVYYHFGTQGSCINSKAAYAGDQITKSAEVEVFSRYYQLGSITICDSTDYYIRTLR